MAAINGMIGFFISMCCDMLVFQFLYRNCKCIHKFHYIMTGSIFFAVLACYLGCKN